MLTKHSELIGAVRRLDLSVKSEMRAQQIVALVLGYQDWFSVAAAVAAQTATYPVSWISNARKTYYELVHQIQGAPLFDEIFVNDPPCAIEELDGDTFDDVRTIAGRSYMYHLLTPEDLAGPRHVRDSRDWRAENLSGNLLTICISPVEMGEPSSGLWFYRWAAWTTREDRQIGHAAGSLYATKRGQWIDCGNAIESADMVSDIAVGAVSAMLHELSQERFGEDGLSGRYATVDDYYVIPSERAKGYGKQLLSWVCRQLLSVKRGNFTLVLDRSEFANAIQFPPEMDFVCDGPGGIEQPSTAREAIAIAFVSRILWPLQGELGADHIEVASVNSLSPRGPYQTIMLVGGVALEGAIPKHIPDEASARRMFEKSAQGLSDLWQGKPTGSGVGGNRNEPKPRLH